MGLQYDRKSEGCNIYDTKVIVTIVSESLTNKAFLDFQYYKNFPVKSLNIRVAHIEMLVNGVMHRQPP